MIIQGQASYYYFTERYYLKHSMAMLKSFTLKVMCIFIIYLGLMTNTVRLIYTKQGVKDVLSS